MGALEPRLQGRRADERRRWRLGAGQRRPSTRCASLGPASSTPAAARAALQPRVDAQVANFRSAALGRWNTLIRTTGQRARAGAAMRPAWRCSTSTSPACVRTRTRRDGDDDAIASRASGPAGLRRRAGAGARAAGRRRPRRRRSRPRRHRATARRSRRRRLAPDVQAARRATRRRRHAAPGRRGRRDFRDGRPRRPPRRVGHLRRVSPHGPGGVHDEPAWRTVDDGTAGAAAGNPGPRGGAAADSDHAVELESERTRHLSPQTRRPRTATCCPALRSPGSCVDCSAASATATSARSCAGRRGSNAAVRRGGPLARAALHWADTGLGCSRAARPGPAPSVGAREVHVENVVGESAAVLGEADPAQRGEFAEQQG
ncbi:MAG: hypothetical protein MZW92_60225 [Comamonadaceae bacterium]|nr:hypothetical protein [Comamonadaceae bacterium]